MTEERKKSKGDKYASALRKTNESRTASYARADSLFRTLVLANAGGGVAVLSFVGAGKVADSARIWPALVVSLFFFGLLAAILSAASAHGRAAVLLDAHLDAIDSTSPPKRTWWENQLSKFGVATKLAAASFGFFFLAGLTGIILLSASLSTTPRIDNGPSAQETPPLAAPDRP